MTYAIRPEPPKEKTATLVLTLTTAEAQELADHWRDGQSWEDLRGGGRALGQSLHQALLAAAKS